MTETDEIEPKTTLITIEQIDVPALFADGQIDPVMEYIRKQVAPVLDTVPDLSTQKARQEIKSAAYKVARSKTLLDDTGKNYAAELKAKVANIDGNRRTLRDALDALRDEIRKPVDELEAAEAKRAEEIQANINQFISAGQLTEGTSEALRKKLDEIKGVEITGDAFGDRQGDAAINKDIAVSNLDRAIALAVQREKDAEELARLREKEKADAAAKKEQEAADKAASEAAEKARVEAEAKAQAKIDAAEKEAREAREAKEAAERKAEEDRKAREAKERKQREDDEARAADVEHRRQVNQAAREALCEWSNLSEEQANDVVTIIAAGRIPNVTIRY